MHNAPYGLWLPWDASATHGAQIDSLIGVVHWFMLLLFVGWGAFFVYCLWRFRARAGHVATYQLPKGKLSKYLEVAVGIFEFVLLLGFSMPVWANYKNTPPAPGKRFEVRVVAQQFQWNFHYPGKDGKFGRTRPELVKSSEGNFIGLDTEGDPDAKDDIVSTELHVPVGQDVYIRIMSRDVIHSFDLPVLRVKQDAIPGMEIPVWFKVNPAMTTAEFRKALTKRFRLDSDEFKAASVGLMAMQDIKGKDGTVILAKDGTFSDEAIAKMTAAGVTEFDAAPIIATEVVCAQLCGNNHFTMHAPLIMQTQEELQKWEEETRNPKPAGKGAEEEFKS